MANLPDHLAARVTRNHPAQGLADRVGGPHRLAPLPSVPLRAVPTPASTAVALERLADAMRSMSEVLTDAIGAVERLRIELRREQADSVDPVASRG